MWLRINMPNFAVALLPWCFLSAAAIFSCAAAYAYLSALCGLGLASGHCPFHECNSSLFCVHVQSITQDIWVVRQLMRQFVDTMFIINNCISSHLWRKENLVRNQKVLKCYQNDCVENFPLFFISLLTIAIVKNSHI